VVEVYKDTETERIETHRRPIGVVACITPWNFPVFCSVQKWAPALLLGNTVVVKPSPRTPLSMLAIAEILKDVFPPGVFNVVTGEDSQDGFSLSKFLTAHPAVRKVSFTGSIGTGKAIYGSVASDMKRVTLECGGNDPAIVRADADIAAAAKGIFGSAMANTGQLCCAAKRVFVHESIMDQFTEEFTKQAATAKFDDGFADGVTHGPIQNKMQFDRVSELVEDAKVNGANILTGGAATEGTPGYFYPPTVITGVKEGVRIVDEEQFGPVVPIMSYKTEEEALERANNCMFGLGASVWGTDAAAANAMAAQVQAGTVWVNQHSDLTGAPFGGMKWSGIGRELGRSDWSSFTELQTCRFVK
jgi:acyl-CoA reductase-like NAD-dependent aldehyde dehydrogenase